MFGVIENKFNLWIFRIWKILATPGGITMYPERLIIDIYVVQNDISGNFYFDYKVVQSNQTELFFFKSVE